MNNDRFAEGAIKSLKEVVESLAACDYKCDAGPLRNNDDFRFLAKIAGVELPTTVAESVRTINDSFSILTGNLRSYLQRRRDEIVEQAKRDIEGLKGDDGYYGVRLSIHRLKCKADFIVNKEKRTVVVLLRGFSTGEVIDRGIAKCAPNDCFNSHIGKAIALRRALGLPVPDEYLNAPQPTEVRVGDVVEMQFESFFTKKLVTDKINPINVCETTIESAAKYFAEGMAKIIDDSRDDEEV